ncbi:MAG: LysM peptidoglycan-binding domain-containing protein [Rhodocyclales bacterium GT-UBC]|nr:MAG: LysM peptidoglycan-binding domain-containing protein [Rhodocyclales bacterium GT-UBC]
MLRIISALILAVTAFCASAEEPLQLVDNPPDRHIVVRGDTLWGIAGKFLQQPWRWPEIWQMNKAEIKNPHLIYPGDVVILDTSGDSPRLRIGKSVGNADTNSEEELATTQTQPKVYSKAVPQVIPSIPPNAIEAFLSQPLIIEATEHDKVARIVATEEERMIMGNGDTAFVTGIPDGKKVNWNVYRPGKPLKDPETGKVIAYEAFFLGTAKLVSPGDPATVRIVSAKEEIHRGDRLIPAPSFEILAYAPHRPEQTVAARVVGIYGGLNEGGGGSIVSINRGKSDGIETGHVLALFRNRVSIAIDADGRRSATPIPEERYALAFVFRTFDHIAYALVVESSKSVIVGDAARNP